MTVCAPCTATKVLASCVDELFVGTHALGDQPIHVWLHDLSTGRITRFDNVGAGTDIKIDTTDFVFMPGHAYELWITLQTKGMDCKENFDIARCLLPYTEEVCCVALRFERVTDVVSVIYYTSQTVYLEEEECTTP